MSSAYDDFMEQLATKAAAKSGNPAALARLGVTYFADRSIMPTDIEAAARLLHAAADEGDAEAQNSLGNFYYFGLRAFELSDDHEALLGTDRDQREAIKWFRKAAEQGHADAQHRLGMAYAGVWGGVTPDYAEAVTWFRKAAEQGHAHAQYSLAGQLLDGRGVAKDATEAVRLWRHLAEQGHAAAQAMLGRCYATGDGVAKNPADATAWLQKAADQGYPLAEEMVANVRAGRAPMARRGCVILLFLPPTAIVVGWLTYRLIS